MQEGQYPIAVLAAMITPAVLILACGSLSLTTSQRLSRSIERTRKLYDEFEAMKEMKKVVPEPERLMLNRQLSTGTKRAVLLQQAMTLLYLAISMFIAASLMIGLFEILDLTQSLMTLALAMTGAALLLAASIVLIFETRLGISSVNEEMRFRRDNNYFIRNEEE
jgi:hypothetical protein